MLRDAALSLAIFTAGAGWFGGASLAGATAVIGLLALLNLWGWLALGGGLVDALAQGKNASVALAGGLLMGKSVLLLVVVFLILPYSSPIALLLAFASVVAGATLGVALRTALGLSDGAPPQETT